MPSGSSRSRSGSRCRRPASRRWRPRRSACRPGSSSGRWRPGRRRATDVPRFPVRRSRPVPGGFEQRVQLDGLELPESQSSEPAAARLCHRFPIARAGNNSAARCHAAPGRTPSGRPASATPWRRPPGRAGGYRRAAANPGSARRIPPRAAVRDRAGRRAAGGIPGKPAAGDRRTGVSVPAPDRSNHHCGRRAALLQTRCRCYRRRPGTPLEYP